MHVTHICPRFKTIHGGGEPVLLNLFNQLAAMGIQNEILTYNFPSEMRSLLDSGIKLTELPKILNRKFENVLMAGIYDLFCSAFTIAYIQRTTDIVCFHTETTIPALFFSKIHPRPKPSLYFCFQPPRFAYDTTEETARSGGTLGKLLPLFKRIYRPLDFITARRADRIATFSNGYKDWIESIYNVRDVAVLPPGVDMPTLPGDLPEHIGQRLQHPETKTLIFVGKLVAWKNVDRLIRVAARIKSSIPQLRVLIVGDGPCMKVLQQQVVDTDMSRNVIFCGYVSGTAVFDYCAAADLLVLLEQNASFGLTLIEANAVGLPVMAFEGGGPSDIIKDRKNGYLMPKDSTDEFIANVIRSHLADEERQSQMREHALSSASRYTWRRFAELFVDLLNDISKAV